MHDTSLVTKILKRSDAKDQLAYLQNALNKEEHKN